MPLDQMDDSLGFICSVAAQCKRYPDCGIFIELRDMAEMMLTGSFWDFCFENHFYFKAQSLEELLIGWLNRYHDLRTLPMAWGYAILPALLLWDRKSTRWGWLAVILGLLWLGETAQLAIPSRQFTWPDMLFSLGGVLLAEGCAIALDRWRHRPVR